LLRSQRFLVGESGSPDLAIMPEVNGVAEAPIRLLRDDLKHIDEPTHRAAAVEAGYSDGLHLTLDTLENRMEIRKADDDRIMLVRPLEEHNAVAVTELQRADGGNYWRIVTSGFRADERLGEIIKVREPAPKSAPGEQTPLIHRANEASGDGRTDACRPNGDGYARQHGHRQGFGQHARIAALCVAELTSGKVSATETESNRETKNARGGDGGGGLGRIFRRQARRNRA